MAKLTVLVENAPGGKLLAEHGLSYFIEADGKQILFDTGHSNLFLQNAEKLGIDLNYTVDIIVLSHGHWDHGDGLRYIKDKTLIAHPGSFIKRYHRSDKNNIGLALSFSEINDRFNLITSSNPYEITNNILFLGEIPRVNNFESQTTPFVTENGSEDFVPDDSALVIIQHNELTIISGCAHSGICNIVEYAKQITQTEKINTVIGGFHLKNNNLQTRETITYMKKQKVKNIYPSHCTELPALLAFYNEFTIQQLKTGQILKL